MRIKLKRVVKSPKSFGFSNEKHFSGVGRNGYARNYGANKYGNRYDNRNRFELRNHAQNNLIIEQISELDNQ